jgi:hypothetical protein
VANGKKKLESEFQGNLKKEIRRMLPGCFIMKLDSSEFQGIPDLLILWEDRWAILEVKRSANSPFQPNQEWYLEQFNRLSFASVIFPENKEAVLHDLQQAFRSCGAPRYIERKQVPLDQIQQREVVDLVPNATHGEGRDRAPRTRRVSHS